ncbi:MAG: type II secretion system protein [bacterium]
MNGKRGFTLLEILIVVTVVGLLAALATLASYDTLQQSRMTRAQEELRNVYTALKLYANDHGGAYPPDTNRDVPPGLEKYLAGGVWPQAPWPNAVFDWENWAPGALAYPPQAQVYQISIRFCDTNGNCTFPNEPWAAGFDTNSAVYYCISGQCRAHSSQPVNHAGYCVNC